MSGVRNGGRGLALLLTGAALAMALARGTAAGPFVPVPHDDTLDLRIAINSAARPEVESLPGIGPVLAERIIRYRIRHGPFRNAADLDAVRGIGGVRARSLEIYVETGKGQRSVGTIDDEIGRRQKGRVDGRR